jgi:hypothetical protein
MDYETIRAHAKALPLEDRKTLIEILELSIHINDPSGPEFEEADITAWRKRSNEMKFHSMAGLTWEHVITRLRSPKE